MRRWLDGAPWLDPRLAPHVPALADPATGLAVESRAAGRPAVAGAGRRLRRAAGPTCTRTIDTTGRTADRRADFDSVYGDWAEVADATPSRPRAHRAAAAATPTCGPALRLAADDPAALLLRPTTTRRWRCSTRTGRRWTRWSAWPTTLRRDTVGDDITYVVNRNINFTNVCYVGCRFCAFAQRERDADAYRLSLDQVADRAEQAVADGRDRGVHAGRHRPRAAGDRVRRAGAGGQEAGARHARARVLADGDRDRGGQGQRVRSRSS